MTTARGDVLIISPATTAGWVTVERELSESLGRLEIAHRVERMELGPSRHLRRAWPLVDAVEASGARAALKRGLSSRTPRAVIFLSTTALFAAPVPKLQRQGIRIVVRLDSPAAVNRTGPENAMQRSIERRRLAAVDLALAMGPRSAEGLRELVSEERIAIVPNPMRLEPSEMPPDEPPRFLAYAANPGKKGLDTIVRAWRLIEFARGEAVLAVAGIDRETGEAYLNDAGAPAGDIEWLGMVPRDQYLDLLRASAAFVSASRIEEHGLAQLEALAAGVPLVTTPSPGAYEAEPIARALAPQLVPETAKPETLAAALSALLAMSPRERKAYAGRSQEEMKGLRPEAVDEALGAALSSVLGPRSPLP